jgi:hypothetical protein
VNLSKIFSILFSILSQACHGHDHHAFVYNYAFIESWNNPALPEDHRTMEQAFEEACQMTRPPE